MSTGDKIQQLRKNINLSQEQLAERIGVSRQAISKWELEESLPNTDKVILLSKLFGVTIDYLLLDYEKSGTDADSDSISNTHNTFTEDSTTRTNISTVQPTDGTTFEPNGSSHKNWIKPYLGRWVKIFLDDKIFQGFYQVFVKAMNEEYLLIEDSDGLVGLISFDKIESISDADIYRNQNKLAKLPRLTSQVVSEDWNPINEFIGCECMIHLVCNSIFSMPQGYYNAIIEDSTTENVLIRRKQEKSILSKDRIVAILKHSH
jgi:transcriptional regulator with XRE-family HTH domain